MNPILRSMAVDKILTQFSVAYRNESYIGELVMPVIKVKERSGKFAKYGKDNLRVEDNLDRAPGTRARSFDYTVSQGSYACTEKAIEKGVPDEMVDNSDDPYDPRRDAAMFAADKVWLNQEVALAAFMADTANITQNVTLSGTSQWSDYANSDPISTVKTARRTIKAATGMVPNTAIMGYDVWEALIMHPDFVDRVKSVGVTDIDVMKKAVANLLQVKNILIGDAVKLTSNQGQTDATDFVWGKHFWLAYVAPKPSLMQVSFGYTIKDIDRLVDRYREESNVQDVVRVRDSYDQTVVDVLCCYLVKNAVA